MIPRPELHRDLRSWARALVLWLSRLTERNPVALPHYSKTNLPRAEAGLLIFVTDDVGGPVVAYSDGTTWRRVSDGAPIS